MIIFKYVIKYSILALFFYKLLIFDKQCSNNNNLIDFIENNNYSQSLSEIDITNNSKIYANMINYFHSIKNNIIKVIYYIAFYDQNLSNIEPSSLTLLYNQHILCEIYNLENNEKTYSIANIYENKYYFCVEYIQSKEHVKFGINVYEIDENNEEVKYKDFFFFDDSIIININSQTHFKNDATFDLYNLYKKYNSLLLKINKNKQKDYLKLSFLQPPLCLLKRNIALIENIWYSNNIYNNYFCFCRGELCIHFKIISTYRFQSCKYYFYLTIIDKNIKLFPRTDYLFADFFEVNIDSADAFPIYQEMIKQNLNAHYLTMNYDIYQLYCLNNTKCINNMEIIYGYRKINGDFLERFLNLILRLKVVVTAEYFESIDNLFYNNKYITYIFLGHGVTYIKSYLYMYYISPKRYNKFLLPNSKIFIDLALKYGWKREDIIKIGYPRWDNYNIISRDSLKNLNSKNEERAIFVMFTWRKAKKGKNLSPFYFNNIKGLLANERLNYELGINNIKIYFCYHHALKEKKSLNINNKNIFQIRQSDISKLIKNCSLIVTDFSSIIFDAIVQRKPIILYIPDALDPNLNDLYIKDYYDTIIKLLTGEIFLDKIFTDLDKVIDKIIYYIKNDFFLEDEKLKLYKIFNLKKKGNTERFIRYIKLL